MDAIQEKLGEVLLVLAGLAVVLLAVILVLVEADVILRLGGRLALRWRSGGSDPARARREAGDPVDSNCAREEQGG